MKYKPTMMLKGVILVGTVLTISDIASSAVLSIGLAPSIRARGQAEAITAGVSGSDALFYNPAALAVNRVQLRLVGIEGSRGYDERKMADSLSRGPLDLEGYFDLLNKKNNVYASATARSVDLVFPYVAVTSFVRGVAQAKAPNEAGLHDYRLTTEAGALGGAALMVGKLSVGLSYYGLVRSSLVSQPSTAQIVTIDQAIEDETFSEQTVPVRDFSSFYYGGAEGMNGGLLYRWWDNNPSGVGISVLNIGTTKFRAKSPFTHSEITKAEEKIEDEALKNDIAINLPEEIPQITNVGMTFGAGGDEESVFSAQISLDYQDIGGKYIENKFAASYEFGVTIPDRLSLALSWPIMNTNWIARAAGKKPQGPGGFVHMGLQSLRASGGYRQKSYISRGLGVTFHFGLQRLISILKLDVDWFKITPVRNSLVAPAKGLSAVLGLTFVF